MAKSEVKPFWEKLRWVAPATLVIFVMPGVLAILHLLTQTLSLTTNTLILLLLTVLLSLGSGVWVSLILSLQSSLFLNYFLTPPFHSFRIASSDDIISLSVFLFSTVTVSALVRVMATKQAEVTQLVQKIEGISSRLKAEPAARYLMGVWLVDLAQRTIHDQNRESKKIHLTPIEWKILEHLLLAQGALVSQSDLLKAVWGEKYEKETNYLRLYLSQLRKKFEEAPKKPVLLITEAGSGYRVIARKVVE